MGVDGCCALIATLCDCLGAASGVAPGTASELCKAVQQRRDQTAPSLTKWSLAPMPSGNRVKSASAKLFMALR